MSRFVPIVLLSPQRGFNPTSTVPIKRAMNFNFAFSKSAQRVRGMTLVEVIMASGITSILALVIGTTIIYSARSYSAMANYIELDRFSRRALDSMSGEIRMANQLVSYSSSRIQLQDADTGANTVYQFDDASSKPEKRILYRV